MLIPWYENELYFEPGTVADVGSLRLILAEQRKGFSGDYKPLNRWRLYVSMIVSKEDNPAQPVDWVLKGECLVAEFRKCRTLQEAQKRAGLWLEVFILNIMIDTGRISRSTDQDE